MKCLPAAMSLVEALQDLQEYEAQAIFRLSSCIGHRAGCAQPGGGVQHRGASWLPNKSLKACNIFFNSLKTYNILNRESFLVCGGLKIA